MAEHSKIEWTDASWTPIRARNKATGKIGWHCIHKSDGCKRCYAEAINMRLGTGLPFKPGHEKDIEIFLDEKMLLAPLRWKKPRMIFVCSMTDAFADFVKDGWLDKMFAIMALAPQHTFQVLTKRPERMRAYLTADRQVEVCQAIDDLVPWRTPHSIAAKERAAETFFPGLPIPLRNVWLGTSCEDQATADERIPHLLATPAVVRFVSYEPAIGPVDFTDFVNPVGLGRSKAATMAGSSATLGVRPPLDQIIVGGESGSKARAFDLAWARSVVAQCKAAGVACFVKQLGARPVAALSPRAAQALHSFAGRDPERAEPIRLRDKKGGDISEWPADLRIRQTPGGER